MLEKLLQNVFSKMVHFKEGRFSFLQEGMNMCSFSRRKFNIVSFSDMGPFKFSLSVRIAYADLWVIPHFLDPPRLLRTVSWSLSVINLNVQIATCVPLAPQLAGPRSVPALMGDFC